MMDGLGLRRVCLGHFRIRWGKIPKGRVATGRVVEAFDELKDGHPRLAVRSEAAPIDQLAFEGGEETLAHRTGRRASPTSLSMDAGFLAASAESDRRGIAIRGRPSVCQAAIRVALISLAALRDEREDLSVKRTRFRARMASSLGCPSAKVGMSDVVLGPLIGSQATDSDDVQR